VQKNLESFIPYILGVVFLDIDVLGKIFLTQRNHRRYFTHHPLFWLVMTFIFVVASASPLFWLSIGCLVHVVPDLLDWGVPIFPFRDLPLSPHILPDLDEKSTENDFSTVYWQNSFLRSLEGILFLSTLIILLSFPGPILFATILLGLPVYILSFLDFVLHYSPRGKKSSE
jgi:hypothetical protein